MVEARIQGSVLKNMVEAVREMQVNDANFIFSCTCFSLIAMDPTRMAMVDFHLLSDAFENYCCHRTMSIGVNVNNIAKILRSAANDDTITIKADFGDTFATLIIKRPTQDMLSHFEMNLVDLDTKPVFFLPEEQSCHAIVKMPSAEFSRICTDLSIFGDTVFTMVTEDCVGFSSKGDIGTSFITCSHNTCVNKADEESTVIETTQIVNLNFGLKYFNCFTKAASLSNTVSIFLSNELHMPVMVQYLIGDKGLLRFCLKQIKLEQ